MVSVKTIVGKYRRRKGLAGGPESGENVTDGPEHGLRPGADAQVAGEVHPTHGSRGIHQKLGRPCDVVIGGSGPGVEHSVAADDGSVRIGQKGVGVALALAQTAGLITGIDAYGGDRDAARVEVLKALLETP